MNLQNCQIYDISPVISSRIAVFPGDTRFSGKTLLDMNKGDNLTLSSIQTTVHLGAHADAPSHYSANGASIGERDLSIYLGPVQVIEVHTNFNKRIYVEDLDGKSIVCPRVLFKTGSFPDPEVWSNEFMALSPSLIDHLAKERVVLVGLDTPSVDLAEDRELLSHHRILAHDMAILEGLILSQVPEGVYDLIALPLRLQNAEASPVRAILVKNLE